MGLMDLFKNKKIIKLEENLKELEEKVEKLEKQNKNLKDEQEKLEKRVFKLETKLAPYEEENNALPEDSVITEWLYGKSKKDSK